MTNILDNFQVFTGDISTDLLNTYLKSDAIAMDTETMGLIPPRDRLCLVQLCDRAGNLSAVKIPKGQTNAPNLKTLMEESTITKVCHYARFDVAQLLHTFGIVTNPIYCTKIASKLARTYTCHHGLRSLVIELEKIELDKTAQSSDWGNIEALTDKQLAYAANDVRYLIPCMDKLTAMLQREDRWELAQECFRCLPVFVHLDLNHYGNVFDHKA
jgi:ribonuclease D